MESHGPLRVVELYKIVTKPSYQSQTILKKFLLNSKFRLSLRCRHALRERHVDERRHRRGHVHVVYLPDDERDGGQSNLRRLC